MKIFLLFATAAFALATPDSKKEFSALLREHPEKVWVESISSPLKAAIQAYNSKEKLKNGKVYGASVRNYSLEGKCPAEVEKDMKQLGCAKKEDVIREPAKNSPIVGPDGRTSPIWQFVCADGGVVKIKPEGDPTSKFTPFPHGSRTLRYPAEAEYRDYRDEIAKVSEEGQIVPRSPADLGPKNLVDAWSKTSHIPLTKCK